MVATYFIGKILVSVSGIIQHKWIGEGLIDNADLAASAQSSTENTSSINKQFTYDESALFFKMQKILQFFLELPQVAGGDLNIEKCACFTVFHRWTGSKATLLKIQDSHPLMKITHAHYGELKTITKKDPTESHRALGWMMTTECVLQVNCSMFSPQAKSQTICRRNPTEPNAMLQRNYQNTDYKCYYLAIISYIIADTRLSIEQCKTIKSPDVCATLNKMTIIKMSPAPLYLDQSG
jgi:hypothetical protein